MELIKYNQAITECNRDFRYQYDHHRYGLTDSWRILDKNGKGDCEDYALTVAWIFSDRNFFKFLKIFKSKELILHYVTVNGEGHAVLEYNGRFVDNIEKRTLSKKQFERKGYQFILQFSVNQIVFRLIKGYTIGTIGSAIRNLRQFLGLN